MPRRRACSVLVLLALVAAPLPARAWGFTAHRLIHARAIDALPPGPLRALFEANRAWVAEHSIDPDLQRSESSEPDHFLDLDSFGAYPFPELPRVEAEHLARHGEPARERGRLPWKVAEVHAELVEALRQGRLERALPLAAALGHYASDAHVPLHAATNYDGQLSGQRGIHGRWESGIFERFQRQIEKRIAPPRVRPIAKPSEAVFDVLLASFLRSRQALASDLSAAAGPDLAQTPQDERYPDLYYSEMWEREGESVVERVSGSIGLTASLWQSAWQAAGRPALDAGFRFRYVRRAVKGVLVSLDGAGAALMDDAVARGLMPALARLRARGATAAGSAGNLPQKTAAAHAALFTGSWADRSGIAGNVMSMAGASVAEQADGYSSTGLRAEPIWVSVARQGLRASVASAPQSFPFEPYLEERRFGRSFGQSLTLFDGYGSLRASPRALGADALRPRPPSGWLGALPAHAGPALEVSFEVAGASVDGLLYDDPEDAAAGFDSLLVTLDKDVSAGVVLKPEPARGADAGAFRSLRLRAGGGEAALFLRLYELAPDASRLLLLQMPPHVLRASLPSLEGAAFAATGGFLGNGASWLYAEGRLGPPLDQGGDGSAERRYLESVALVIRQFGRLADFAALRTAPDLLVAYLPYPDEAEHVWGGFLDPGLPSHDPALAARLRPYHDEVMRAVDGYLARLVENAGPDAVIAVAADHGQRGVDRVFRPNVALREAGLLELLPEGGLDLARSRVVYHEGNSGFLLVNTQARGGPVAPDAEAEVRRAAAAALVAARDSESNRPLLAGAVDAHAARVGEAASGLGGPAGGDLYLDPAPGVLLSAALSGPRSGAARPRGDHLGGVFVRDAQAAFSIAGPGVAAKPLGLVRQIQIAPTLCALLGIDPPAQAEGRPIEAALAFER
jgi:predicted AlkP superfamily pyrophosphatase or phosphodiesterase